MIGKLFFKLSLIRFDTTYVQLIIYNRTLVKQVTTVLVFVHFQGFRILGSLGERE